MQYELTLPVPPSVNHYWGSNGKRRFLGKRGKEFTRHVKEAFFEIVGNGGHKLGGRLRLSAVIHFSDKRRRDLDNCIKSLQDALQKAGVFNDDEQIDVLHLERGEVVKPGVCYVTVSELE